VGLSYDDEVRARLKIERQQTYEERITRRVKGTPETLAKASVTKHASEMLLDRGVIDGVEVGKYPAMLAPVMRGPKFLTYHVTYLHGGKKVAHDPARKILPGPSTVGASVPLYSAGPVLGVAEGIETAIAAKMLTGIPTWAALNAGNMAKWNCPPGVEHVVIFGDNDENYAGQAAAYTLAHRLKCSGLIVEIRFPEIVGDWNDVLLIARPQSAA
jgi:phage/plasmid primase-like uncharacterized protein